MKSLDGIISVLMTLAVVALATTLVLPGRQTGTVVKETFGGLSKLTSASLGK